MFVSAAVHGDELNGIEIISRLIAENLKLQCGTLIYVPMVNVYGVLNQSRYMPDRRDLNRCFPGSKKGSLAGRLAHTFLESIVSHCDYGIDLHTGAIHRSNLPQIRANLEDEETKRLAEAFAVLYYSMQTFEMALYVKRLLTMVRVCFCMRQGKHYDLMSFPFRQVLRVYFAF